MSEQAEVKISFDDFCEVITDEIISAYFSEERAINYAAGWLKREFYAIHERYLEALDCTLQSALVMAEDALLNELELIRENFKKAYL
ncbi:hypothetical protein [Listeria costaricensis]|uniref:hypothetical protein n=1 Tax=Listeria costaricensis TaxID=2026604 RepID=UPI000C07321A|nr:hypothetical protein [Listeria costaricensis]